VLKSLKLKIIATCLISSLPPIGIAGTFVIILTLAIKSQFLELPAPASGLNVIELLDIIILVAIFAIICTTGLSILLSVRTAKKFTTPINDIVKGVRKIARGDLAYQIYVESFEELKLLTQGINVMVADIKGLVNKSKESEEAMKRLYDKSEKISELKSNLITFASHEFKTPLIPILGWAEFMQKTLKEGKSLDKLIGQEEIDGILRSARKLHKIIEDFLDVGRIDSGKLKLEYGVWSIAQLIKNAIETVLPSAQFTNISIRNEIRDENLFIDGFRIEQVITNLLSNAVKFSPSGTVVRVISEQNQDFYKLSVTDQGAGFTTEQLKDIWQPFSTSYLEKKDAPIPGTGIGLFLAKSIIDAHNGKIEIFSEGRNKGSTVKIYFPKKDKEISIS
jgi:signal transduction histidine kinase